MKTSAQHMGARPQRAIGSGLRFEAISGNNFPASA
jgi:hypothetical protein